jgi:redox-sensitive bicupin YhaK (pirin superfamily)
MTEMSIRRANERGEADHGWLHSFHTFSFADYYDPAHMGFRALRVINEDRVQPGRGFGTHPHRDMEIISYVLEGALAHRDSLGTGSVIRPGDVQRMSAGTGVTHSEFNASNAELVHFLQIWILPARTGVRPSYEQKTFTEGEREGQLRLVASPDGRDGSLTINQDVTVYAGLVPDGSVVGHTMARGRHTYVHVARGHVTVDGARLGPGDAAALSAAGDSRAIEIEGLAGDDRAEVLVFDLA